MFSCFVGMSYHAYSPECVIRGSNSNVPSNFSRQPLEYRQVQGDLTESHTSLSMHNSLDRQSIKYNRAGIAITNPLLTPMIQNNKEASGDVEALVARVKNSIY